MFIGVLLQSLYIKAAQQASASQPDELFLPVVVSNAPTYAHHLLRLFGQSSVIGVWGLSETSGETAVDLSGNLHNGVYSGVSLASLSGPSLQLVPFFPGSAATVDVYSTGLQEAFNPQAGGIGVWLKPRDGSIWGDGVLRDLFYFSAGSQNHLLLRKEAAAALITAQMVNGNRANSYQFGMLDQTGWGRYWITWSKADDRIRVYRNGQRMAELTGLGEWSGGLSTANFGSQAGGSNAWLGYLDTAILLNREPTLAEIREDADYAPAMKIVRISALGDSITGYPYSYFRSIVAEYNAGETVAMNHADQNQTIIANMDAQTAAAANDDADIIICALGTVDGNNGNMAALQAEVEENLAELKTTNPRAKIYYMNVLPRWESVNGLMVDKSHIRAAISAACIKQGVTCWDTYTIPWINSTDTTDGLHPNPAGYAKITSEILKRLP